MPPQGSEIHADAAENAKRDVKSISGVALGEQLDDVHVTFVPKRRLDRIADADHPAAVFVREVQVLQLSVHLHEGCSNPVVECLCATAHSGFSCVTASTRVA